MAATTTTRRATTEPPIRIQEIDEALRWSALTYTPRDRMWERWVNHLLDQRLRLMRTPTTSRPHGTR